jgi:hypothetical protein
MRWKLAALLVLGDTRLSRHWQLGLQGGAKTYSLVQVQFNPAVYRKNHTMMYKIVQGREELGVVNRSLNPTWLFQIEQPFQIELIQTLSAGSQ